MSASTGRAIYYADSNVDYEQSKSPIDDKLGDEQELQSSSHHTTIHVDDTLPDATEHNQQQTENLLPSPTASTKRQALGALAAFIYFMCCSTVLLSVMNFVHERVPTSMPPLPDLGHEIITKLHPEFLGDIVMGSMYALIGCAVVLSSMWRWKILTRFLLSYGSLYLLRTVTITATSLPATENHCYYNYTHIDNFAWNTFLGLISLGSLNKHCGDLLFSGHACSITLIMLSFWCYFSSRWIINTLVTLLGFTGFVFIIGTRSHYTVDVVVAFYLTIFVYKSMPDNWDIIILKAKNLYKKTGANTTTLLPWNR
jgi:hypothetical protein